MKNNYFDEIQILDATQAEKEKKFESQGFQYYRDGILRILFSLRFSEKFKIIKKVDREILEKINTYQGTKAVHTLDYMHKIPSRKKNLSKIDEIVLLWRSISMKCEVQDYFKERRKKLIKLIK